MGTFGADTEALAIRVDLLDARVEAMAMRLAGVAGRPTDT
jgi:hypothetical protein